MILYRGGTYLALCVHSSQWAQDIPILHYYVSAFHTLDLLANGQQYGYTLQRSSTDTIRISIFHSPLVNDIKRALMLTAPF